MLRCPWCDVEFVGGSDDEAALHVHQEHKRYLEDFLEAYEEYKRFAAHRARQSGMLPGMPLFTTIYG